METETRVTQIFFTKVLKKKTNKLYIYKNRQRETTI